MALRLGTNGATTASKPRRFGLAASDRGPPAVASAEMEQTLMDPGTLSRELRLESSRFLGLRRKVLGTSLVASGAMAMISLYQMGIIRHLPEPPFPYLNADEVDAAAEAYAIFETPDAVLGLASYAATAWLAAAGGEDRWRTRSWLPLALAGKAAGDAIFGSKLTVDQWTKHRAFCFWCLLGASASIASVPLAIPEARAALRHMR